MAQQVMYRAPRGGLAGGSFPLATGGAAFQTAGAPRGRGALRGGRGAARGGRGGTRPAAGEAGGDVYVRGGRTSVRGRGGRIGRGGSTAAHASTGINEANLELSGFPAELQYQDMVNFLNGNAPAGFRYIKMTLGGGTCRVTLHASEVSAVMAALQGKPIAPGHALVVQLGAQTGRALTNAERETLRACVRSAFANTSLDLSGLGARVPFANFNSTAFTTELFNAIHSSAAGAVSINLANNQIASLTPFNGLLRVAPKLQNLSLQANFLASVDQLDALSGFKDTLSELLLSGNPLCHAFTAGPGNPPQHAAQLDYTVYQQLISSMFPALRMLDGLPLRALIEFDLPAALSSAAPAQLLAVKDSFFDSPAHQKMCFALVARYFELYDRDRQDRELINVYADQAVFSLTYQPEPRHAHAEYSKQNRNIALLLNGAKHRHAQELNLLKVGPVAIVSALHALPPSRHDRDSFVADVCKVPTSSAQINAVGGLLHITIRGQFMENEHVLRCFHRTFLCTAPTSDSQAKGWPVSILHDALYIGAAKNTAKATAAAAAGSSIAATHAAALALSPPPKTAGGRALTAEDELLVASLCRATGVDANTAMQLLMACQGNIDMAAEKAQAMRAAGQLGSPQHA